MSIDFRGLCVCLLKLVFVPISYGNWVICLLKINDRKHSQPVTRHMSFGYSTASFEIDRSNKAIELIRSFDRVSIRVLNHVQCFQSICRIRIHQVRVIIKSRFIIVKTMNYKKVETNKFHSKKSFFLFYSLHQ